MIFEVNQQHVLSTQEFLVLIVPVAPPKSERLTPMSPTPTELDPHTDSPAMASKRAILLVGAVVGAVIPAFVVRFSSLVPPLAVAAVIFGLAIVAAAFLLAWGAEAAQVDISAGLAIAVLAFIAVLPEYAVDMVFASKGGRAYAEHGRACQAIGSTDESPCSLALANMTGSNRLLIGIGWTLVVGIAWYQWRRRGIRQTDVRLERTNSVEVSYLLLASLYALTLPLKGSLTLVDAGVLVAIFVAYTIRIAKAPAEEPHLVGPARVIGELPTRKRRFTYGALLLFAALVILLCAERFAEALVEGGMAAGISEFVLVQWVAPLASEAPELLIAAMFAWRMVAARGLSTLVSSKVNQWTLLVGTLPVVFAITSSSTHGLPLDALQREELFLTGAQAFFGVAVLISLSLSIREALLLFSLFWAQFVVRAVVPEDWAEAERIGVGIAYMVIGTLFLIRQRAYVRSTLRDGFRTPYRVMSGEQ